MAPAFVFVFVFFYYKYYHYLYWCYCSNKCLIFKIYKIAMSANNLITSWRTITVTPHERHGVSNYQQRECCFNSLSRITPRKISQVRITGPLCRESTGNGWIPLTKGQIFGKRFHVMTSVCNQQFGKNMEWHRQEVWAPCTCKHGNMWVPQHL